MKTHRPELHAKPEGQPQALVRLQRQGSDRVKCSRIQGEKDCHEKV